MVPGDRKEASRRRLLTTLEKFAHDFDVPASEPFWSPTLDAASGDELVAIQNAKLAAVVPFLYENSSFYRRRFDRLGLIPDDIRSVADLTKWPVVTSAEMAEDALENPPYGSYSTMTDELWAERGWMAFSTSGTSGSPRLFRYSHIDRKYWEWANARALYAMDIRTGDTVFLISGFGPHVWQWGVTFALARMGVAAIPGGGLDSRARARLIERLEPTVIACTPSYALHLGRAMEEEGLDPARSSVRTVFLGGEPAMGIGNTRRRIGDLWGARVTEFYGCTEVAPAAGGFGCRAQPRDGAETWTHLFEDVQIWELVDAARHEPVADGERGITVCTLLNSESSPQLRFLVGDYTVFDHTTCDCGRSHVRAMGCMTGRADDIINLRGIKFSPSQLEAAVRGVKGLGDEYEIVIETTDHGLDIMTVRVEHGDHLSPDRIAREVAGAVRSRCEIRTAVEVLAPGALAKTEFKAKRVRDLRGGQTGEGYSSSQ